MDRNIFGGLGILLLGLAFHGAGAQVPDSGRILEQLKEAPVAPPPRLPPARIEQPAAASPPDGARIEVRRFRIRGNQSFTEEQLHDLIREGEGRSLSLVDLNQLAERITRLYRDNGYLVARAYVPAQDVTEGTIEIAVLEGVLGQVDVRNAVGLRSNALAPLRQVETGEPVSVRRLESSLLTLADVPGVDIRSTLRPGIAPGTTDLVVDVEQGRRFTGSLDFDNFGSRFTGANRLTANVYANNPLNIGDQLGVSAQASDGDLTYGRAYYQVPVGESGLRLGAAFSSLRYRLGEQFSVLDADGEATTSSAYGILPLYRSRRAGLFVQLQYDDRQLDDRVGATSTSTGRSLQNWVAGIFGNALDDFGGGGATSFNLGVTTGHVGLDPTTAAIDAATARTQGSFDVWRLSAQRAQRLTSSWSLYASYTAQWAGKNLDSSEKMSVGGAAGVRAYPQGEAPADEARLLTLEARWQFAEHWQAQAFYDDAAVRFNKEPFAAVGNERRLSGYGLGASYAREPGWLARAFIAWRGAAVPTSDVDRSPRVWVQLRRLF